MRIEDQAAVETSEATAAAPKPAKKPAPKKKATKPPMGKATDVVTIADIAKELGVDPSKARAKLRASKLKHAHGASWEWPKGSATIKDVRALLKE
jgi:hypothetical protein